MTFPRRASLALLTLAALAAAAFPRNLVSAQTAESAPLRPASPNGRIVYHSDQAGDPGVNDIYTMDADGKHETRLTTNTGDDSGPAWSPDGKTISFVSDRGRGFEVYLMGADGTNQRPLRADSPLLAFDARWSPDGTRLAYVSGGDLYAVEVFAPGGGDSTAAPLKLSNGKAANTTDLEACWSPSGQQLVVSNTADACDLGGCSDLYVVNADNTGRAPLVTANGFDRSPRWSPSGDFVAYDANRGDGRGTYVIDAAGVGPEVKVSGDSGSLGAASWSPDGSRLAFSTGIAVYAVNPDGTGMAALTAADPAGTTFDPFWSPDGQKVAYKNGGDIYVISADGSSRRPANYTKTRRADESASSWQKLATQ